MSSFSMSELFSSYVDESRERLDSINSYLVDFESGDLDEESLVQLRRDAHTIKGSSLMFGVNDLGDVAHLFEDVMDEIIKTPSLRHGDMIQFLFDLHDAMRDRVADPEGPELSRKPFDEKLKKIRVDLLEQQKTDPFASAVSGQSASNIPTVEAESEADTTSSPVERVSEETPVAKKKSARTASSQDEVVHIVRVDAERLLRLNEQMSDFATGRSTRLFHLKKLNDMYRQLRFQRANYAAQLEELLSKADDRQCVLLEGLLSDMDTNLTEYRQLIDELSYQQNLDELEVEDLRNRVTRLMLSTLYSVFANFPRAVRDVSQKYGKKVKLAIEGGDVEVAQTVCDALLEPLIHLLNNAVAHGIELPEERLAAGKPEQGSLWVKARQIGSKVEVEVGDDGRGLDGEYLKKVAVERGVANQQEVDVLDEHEALELIFWPGFSTQEGVTRLAGRGIGMYAVQEALRQMTGSIKIETEIAKGSRFIMTIPVSIAVQAALFFRMGEQVFAIMTHLLVQAIAWDESCVSEALAGRRYWQLDEQKVPLVDLRSMLSKQDAGLSSNPKVLFARHFDGLTGIVVDDVLYEQKVQVRELDPYLSRYQPKGLMAYTINNDGDVVLLLDPQGLREMGRTAPNVALLDIADQGSIRSLFAGLRVLLVDDSIIARAVEQKLLESLGAVVELCVDGQDALERLSMIEVDVVVSDVDMPRLDGFGLLKALRKDPELSSLPVLMLSTRESAEDRQFSLDYGASAYLSKRGLSQASLRHAMQKVMS